MPFFFWLGLWEVCAVLFGSGAALQYKQLTSSSWPLWTTPAASHEHAGACRAQWLLSLTGVQGSQPGRSCASGHRKRVAKPRGLKTAKLPAFFMTPQLFSTSQDIKRLWKILLCFSNMIKMMALVAKQRFFHTVSPRLQKAARFERVYLREPEWKLRPPCFCRIARFH